jgi:hypothetical protein
MTVLVARNATETIGMINTEAHAGSTDCMGKLSQEYIFIPVKVYDSDRTQIRALSYNITNKISYAGGDYMPYTRLNYPFVFNPLLGRDSTWQDSQGLVRTIEQAGWDDGTSARWILSRLIWPFETRCYTRLPCGAPW